MPRLWRLRVKKKQDDVKNEVSVQGDDQITHLRYIRKYDQALSQYGQIYEDSQLQTQHLHQNIPDAEDVSEISQMSIPVTPTTPVNDISNTSMSSLSGIKKELAKSKSYIFSRSVTSLSLHRSTNSTTADLSRQIALRDSGLSRMEVSRQCILHELLYGEDCLIDDLKSVQRNYYQPMLQLGILNEEHLETLFYNIYRFVPLHQQLSLSLGGLLTQLNEKDEVKMFPSVGIGEVLREWMDTIYEPYIDYCPHLVLARDLLDVRKDDLRLTDYLRRCVQSVFSRRLDLWSFLDSPRERMMRYRLLLSRILETTDPKSEDCPELRAALTNLNHICVTVDKLTAQKKCELVLGRIQMSQSVVNELLNSGDEDNAVVQLMHRQTQLLLDGSLRDDRRCKMTVFLMQDVLLLTRCVQSPVSQGMQISEPRYRLICKPLACRRLHLEDVLPDLSGNVSIASGRSNSFKHKYCFRLRYCSMNSPSDVHVFTLHAANSHDKDQWMKKLRLVVQKEVTIEDYDFSLKRRNRVSK